MHDRDFGESKLLRNRPTKVSTNDDPLTIRMDVHNEGINKTETLDAFTEMGSSGVVPGTRVPRTGLEAPDGGLNDLERVMRDVFHSPFFVAIIRYSADTATDQNSYQKSAYLSRSVGRYSQ